MSLLSFYDRTLVSLGKTDILDTSNPADRSLARVAKQHAIALDKARSERPLLRTRFSGPVGLEVDWSVRESDLSKPIHDLVRKYGWPFVPTTVHREFFGGMHGKFYPFRTAAHGCVLTANWSDDMVRDWTIAAHGMNVHFHGERGYKVHKNLPPKSASSYSIRKANGLIVHKRSKASMALRRLRKVVRSYRPLTEPLIQCPFPGAKSIRKDWWSCKDARKMKFSDFKKERQRSVTSVWCCRYPVPDIVVSALEKIYSVCVPAPVHLDRVITLPNKKVLKPSDYTVSFEDTAKSPVIPRVRCGKITLQEKNSPGSDRNMRSTLLNFGKVDKPTIKGRIGTAQAALSWF